MTLDVKCDRCPNDIEEPGGALVFSPPLWGIKVQKRHVCMACWALLLRWFESDSTPDRPDLVDDP